MIPMRTRSVFKSRWMALLWAAGIIWFAYDTASSQPQGDGNSTNAEQPTDVTGAPITPDEQQKAVDVLKNF
jgi:hypothetical protein